MSEDERPAHIRLKRDSDQLSYLIDAFSTGDSVRINEALASVLAVRAAAALAKLERLMNENGAEPAEDIKRAV